MRISSTSIPAHPSPTAHNYTAGNNHLDSLHLAATLEKTVSIETASPRYLEPIGILAILESNPTRRATPMLRLALPDVLRFLPWSLPTGCPTTPLHLLSE